ncbi:hypothetical protein [Streptomyces tirandamycinicus]|uniref:Uncharacterized protein n=1 Tax=Streptomyces tirandamycinicus TaxID=2174846 RepID=A0A2S1T283_9ACTN|nr:hypothetical protein [Streptomyces tirandamycinicus]AWI32627.1 hypothetical protein DDW44_30375 [Streptomyces tirandamycinicus]
MPSTSPEQNPTNNASTADEQPFDPLYFPPDLVQKQQALAAAYAELHAFSANPDLPWSVEPGGGWDDTGSGRWRETARPETGGWTDEQNAEYDRLWAQARERAIDVSCHPHWNAVRQHCSPEDVVKARQALKTYKGATLAQEDIAAAA